MFIKTYRAILTNHVFPVKASPRGKFLKNNCYKEILLSLTHWSFVIFCDLLFDWWCVLHSGIKDRGLGRQCASPSGNSIQIFLWEANSLLFYTILFWFLIQGWLSPVWWQPGQWESLLFTFKTWEKWNIVLKIVGTFDSNNGTLERLCFRAFWLLFLLDLGWIYQVPISSHTLFS